MEEKNKRKYRVEKITIVPPDSKNCGFEEDSVDIQEREMDGKTIFEFYKDNKLIAITDENGNIEYTEEYKKYLKEVLGESYSSIDLDNRMNIQITLENILENDNKSKNNEKEENKITAVTKEQLQEVFGDKYVVAAEIDDKEISEKFSGIEGFIGNPLMAYNKETKQFVFIGNDQNGNIKESELIRTSSVVNVSKYNQNGTIKEEVAITGMIFIPPQNEDALSIEMNEYGEVEINKVVNARSDNPILFPVDTKQTVPTTMEIENMKQNGEKMQELELIINEMYDENLIDSNEANNLKEEIATNGKTVEEDREMLNNLAEQKRREKDQSEKTIDDEDDGMPPRNPFDRRYWH